MDLKSYIGLDMFLPNQKSIQIALPYPCKMGWKMQFLKSGVCTMCKAKKNKISSKMRYIYRNSALFISQQYVMGILWR